MGARILIFLMAVMFSLPCFAQQGQPPRHQFHTGGGKLFPIGMLNNTDTGSGVMMANGLMGTFIQPINASFYLRSGLGISGQLSFGWWKADADKAALWAQKTFQGTGIEAYTTGGRYASFLIGPAYARRFAKFQLGGSLQFGYMSHNLPGLNIMAYYGPDPNSNEIAFDYRNHTYSQEFFSGMAEGYISFEFHPPFQLAVSISYSRTMSSKGYNTFLADTRSHRQAHYIDLNNAQFEMVRVGMGLGVVF